MSSKKKRVTARPFSSLPRIALLSGSARNAISTTPVGLSTSEVEMTPSA
jgi:hypothetical protein